MLWKRIEEVIMNNWINMRDELPPFHTDILFYVDGEVMKGWFYANTHKFREYYKNSVAEFYKTDVTHWMPMPEPPRKT